MTQKPQCSATVYHQNMFSPSRCSRSGVVQEIGKWWCKQHAPCEEKARHDASRLKHELRWQVEKHARDRAIKAEHVANVAVAFFKQKVGMDDLEKAVAEYERLAND